MLGVMQGVSKQRWPHTMDAATWADEWIKLTHNMGRDAFNDKGYMIGWFANSIMAGYDTADMRGGKLVHSLQQERDALAARVAALEVALRDATEHFALAVKVAEERDGREHYFDRKVIAEWRALAAPESA